MTKRQQTKELKAAGFTLERVGGKHEIWRKGDERITVSRNGRIPSYHTYRAFKLKLRRAAA